MEKKLIKNKKISLCLARKIERKNSLFNLTSNFIIYTSCQQKVFWAAVLSMLLLRHDIFLFFYYNYYLFLD